MVDQIAHYLEVQGLGTVKTSANNPTTWPIYKDTFQEGTTDSAICVAQYQGLPPVDEMGDTPGAVVAEQPGLQVRTRHTDAQEAQLKIEAIWAVLHKKGNANLGSPAVRYLLIEANGQPFPIGSDPNDRYVYASNFQVAKERG